VCILLWDSAPQLTDSATVNGRWHEPQAPTPVEDWAGQPYGLSMDGVALRPGVAAVEGPVASLTLGIFRIHGGLRTFRTFGMFPNWLRLTRLDSESFESSDSCPSRSRRAKRTSRERPCLSLRSVWPSDSHRAVTGETTGGR